jgi:hypothetical protein
MSDHTVRYYVLEDDYLVGYGGTEAEAMACADRTEAAERAEDGEQLDPAHRVVFAAVTTFEGHVAILTGFSPAPALEHPHFRCVNGHVSTRILKTEERGDRCLTCGENTILTFPEDVDGELPKPD